MARTRRPFDDDIPRDDQPAWYFDIDRAADEALRKPFDLPNCSMTKAEAQGLMSRHEADYRREVAQNLQLYPRQYYLAEYLAVYTIWRAAFSPGRGDVLEHAETPPERLPPAQVFELLNTGKITFRTQAGKTYTVNPVGNVPAEQRSIAFPAASASSAPGPGANLQFHYHSVPQHSQMMAPATPTTSTQLTWEHQTPSTLGRLASRTPSYSSYPQPPNSKLMAVPSMALPVPPGGNLHFFSGQFHTSNMAASGSLAAVTQGQDAAPKKKRTRGRPSKNPVAPNLPLPSMLDPQRNQSPMSPGTFAASVGHGGFTMSPSQPTLALQAQSPMLPGASPAPLSGGQVAVPDPQAPRRRTNRRMGACTACRKVKQACSGGHPSCDRCTAKNLVCAYLPPTHTLGPYDPALHQGMQIYNAVPSSNQPTLQQQQHIPQYQSVYQQAMHHSNMPSHPSMDLTLPSVSQTLPSFASFPLINPIDPVGVARSKFLPTQGYSAAQQIYDPQLLSMSPQVKIEAEKEIKTEEVEDKKRGHIKAFGSEEDAPEKSGDSEEPPSGTA
ncbi:uncharacterized protein PAC_19434 [Phialocephala subalpina]|uniref:Zn(2)-C6 fungal-type domain-containing protein n=1 Tax=Phialocephala subalpina TaxID=576137 RepID=A0A1L7XWX0_9HELO|nr:uncharacterized protein PAC_19434 [Phialocephala subalpina]